MKKVRVALCVSTLAFAAALAAGCATTETHNLTLVPKQEPTCTEEGHGQYYSCSDCGKYFSDAQGTTEISLNDIAIPALGHDLHLVEAKESTCTQEGNIAYYDCSRCDVNFADEAGTQELTESPLLGKIDHEMQIVGRLEPTYDEDGHIAHYHCSLCGNDYADSWGDTMLTQEEIVLPKYEDIGTVTLTFTAYQNGEIMTPEFSETQVTLTSKNVAGEELTGVANGASVSIENAYNDDYTITAGNFTGEVSFEKGTTSYSVELQYPFVASTETTSTTGLVEIDLSKMNDANHKIVMSDQQDGSHTRYYTKATLTLPEALENDDEVGASFTVKYKGSGLNAVARFGFMMAEGVDAENHAIGNGLFVIGDSQNPESRLQVCPFRYYDYNMGIFDGWDTSVRQHYEAVKEALTGNGLRITMVRQKTAVRMYAYLNDVWVKLGETTCEQDAKTQISILILFHEWEFSEITYGEYTWTERQEATPTEPGCQEHYSYNGAYFDASGNPLTEEDMYIAPSLPHASVTFTSVTGNKYNDAEDVAEQFALSGTIKLTDPDGGVITGTLTDGAATLENVYKRTYTVEVTTENGDIFDGSVTIGEETSYVFPTKKADCLQYRYATFTSTIESIGGSYTIDTSKMNNVHHIIGMNNFNAPGRTDYYTKATYAISDEVANSKYVIASFWVKYLDSDFTSVSRFGVEMADKEGLGVAVFGKTGNELHVYPLYGGVKGENDIFDGYSPVWKYYAAVYQALMSSARMHIQIVRADTDIYMYANLAGVWYLLGQTECDTDDKTQISFVILSGNWEIYDPSIAVMNYVEEKQPTSESAGNIAHYTWTTPNKGYDSEFGKIYYFNTDGTKTTEEAVALPNSAVLDSVTITVNGKKDGATAALSGSLSGAFGALTVTGNVENGTVILTDLRAGTYTLTMDDYDGTVTITEGTTEYTVTMEYRYAVNTSRGSTAVVDLSKMNDAGHAISMSETTGNTGKSNYAEATLNLSDGLSSSKNVTVEFTVKMTGTISAHSRFGVKITDNGNAEGFYVIMNSTSTGARFQVGNLQSRHWDGLFSKDWDTQHDSYTDTVAALVAGEGLQCRVVRTGGTMMFSMNIGGEWVLMAMYTCNANAATDISFSAGGSNLNTWTFSDITVTDNSVQA